MSCSLLLSLYIGIPSNDKISSNSNFDLIPRSCELLVVSYTGEAFYVAASIAFFKGLQVYPQPQVSVCLGIPPVSLRLQGHSYSTASFMPFNHQLERKTN